MSLNASRTTPNPNGVDDTGLVEGREGLSHALLVLVTVI
jgi:hypothetical protein